MLNSLIVDELEVCYLNGLITNAFGTKLWYLNGKLHREDGPAIECFDGYKEWYLNGDRHREDGPAIECTNGTKYWYKDGKKHRKGGPAITYLNGREEWWRNGVRYFPKDQFRLNWKKEGF